MCHLHVTANGVNSRSCNVIWPMPFPQTSRLIRRIYMSFYKHFGGYVAMAQGADLTVYFGYPLAHEDDV